SMRGYPRASLSTIGDGDYGSVASHFKSLRSQKQHRKLYRNMEYQQIFQYLEKAPCRAPVLKV
ncbi:hypothetical protein NDU88_006971, partial [Pleurodeles waltl]